MIKYYGISFKNDGKIYYFKSDINSIPLNTNVIVETERGKQFGKVKSELDETKIKINLEEIKNVLRIASDEDYKQYMDNLKEASEAANKANQYAKELDLKMKFIDKINTIIFIFYFSSTISQVQYAFGFHENPYISLQILGG